MDNIEKPNIIRSLLYNIYDLFFYRLSLKFSKYLLLSSHMRNAQNTL